MRPRLSLVWLRETCLLPRHQEATFSLPSVHVRTRPAVRVLQTVRGTGFSHQPLDFAFVAYAGAYQDLDQDAPVLSGMLYA